MKMPEPVAWMDRDGDVYKETPELSRAPHQKLFTEAQLREALASHELFGQLQEQNTYLDKVASELQDTCDRQAMRLASHEAVMRMALDALLTVANPKAPAAIKALEEQLK